MKPIIGMSPSIKQDDSTYFVSAHNIQAVEAAGGIPFILPFMLAEADIEQMVAKIDGLYLTGGNDIDPTYYHEEPLPKLGSVNPLRDQFEKTIIEKTLVANKPILGICRGSQILNVALGGTMYQDIYSQHEAGTLLQHDQNAPVGHGSHFAEVAEGSLLHRIVGTDKLRINSRHHQANREMGDGLQVCATASDGIIEAIESTAHDFVLGLQWHPENLANAGDGASKKIIKAFIDSCQK